MSEASKSESGVGETALLSIAGVAGSVGGCDFLPRKNVRFRFALTGVRSAALPEPEDADSRGGTLRTVKCSRGRVYGERV